MRAWIRGTHLVLPAIVAMALCAWSRVEALEVNPSGPSLAVAARFQQEADSLSEAGKYREAIEPARRALAIRELLLGPDHPEVSADLINMGILLARTGDYAGARPLLERALAILERAKDPDPLLLARGLMSLGAVLAWMDNHAGGLVLQERALEIQEKALGPNHSEVERTLQQLAVLLANLGDYPAARRRLERALAIREKALGSRHLDLVPILQDLANVLVSMGDKKGARRRLERALAIQERALGPDHLDLVATLRALGILHLNYGGLERTIRWGGLAKPNPQPKEDAKARSFLERALAIREKALGPDHLDVANSLDELVVLHRRAGDDAGARRNLERSLVIRRSALGPDDPDVEESLDELAGLLIETGDVTGARELFEHAPIGERAIDERQLQIATDLKVRANFRMMAGDVAGACVLLERALAIQERDVGDHLEVAQILNDLANLRFAIGRIAEARPLLERALQIRERALGPAHADVATTLLSLAGLYASQGEPAVARGQLERALAIRERVLGPQSSDVAEVLEVLGALSLDGGSYSQARSLLERALVIRETANADTATLARTLASLGRVLQRQGDYGQARSVYERALAMLEKAEPESEALAGVLTGLGEVLHTTGNHTQARPVLERALEIREQARGPDDPYVAMTLQALAHLLSDMGDHVAARSLYERALAILEKAGGPEGRDVATCLSNLARQLRIMGDLAGARSLYERALAMQEKELGPDHPEMATILNNLANVFILTGDHAQARPLLERSLALDTKALGEDHPETARVRHNLANVMWLAGDHAEARSFHEQALAIRERSLGPDHLDVAESLANLASLLWDMGDVPGALRHALRAEAIGREHFRATTRVLPERQAMELAGTGVLGTRVSLSLLVDGAEPDLAREVLDAQVRSRALVLDELAARHRSVRRSREPEVERVREDYRAASQHYATMLTRGPDPEHPERHRQELEQARQARERSERALSERSAAFRREQKERAIGLREVAAALPRGGALVAYVSYERRAGKGRGDWTPSYLAYVVRGGAEDAEVIPLGEAGAIDSLIVSWREEAGRPVRKQSEEAREAAYRRAGGALRAKVWDPLVAHLAGVERVYVVPDGSLSLVNLATLPREDGSYMVERGPLLHTLSAERDVVTLGERGESGVGLLAMGAPAFDQRAKEPRGTEKKGKGAIGVPAASESSGYRGARSGCADFVGLEFSPLPETRREVKEIAELWRGKGRSTSAGAGEVRLAVELTGAEAGERAFKRVGPGHAVLHVATHGFFITGRCRAARDDGGTRGIGVLAGEREPPVAAAGENPLVLSGLALAGANRREKAGPEEEDGILTAEEIAALDLGGVEWAVLSACETGLGEVRSGEGVFGLRRAFQVAGARTLVMSLWAVDDEATRRWMTALYAARYERKLGTAESMREASLTVLEERRRQGHSAHPFYWGAFVAAGDWR